MVKGTQKREILSHVETENNGRRSIQDVPNGSGVKNMPAMHEMWQEPQVQSLGRRKADSNPCTGHVLGIEGINYLNDLYYSHTQFVEASF